MAKDVERLVLELSADVSRLDRGMKQGQAIIQRQTRAIERQFDQMNKRTVGSVTAMSSGINSAIGGIALGLAAREVQQYADAWTRASNSIKAAGSTNEEASQQLDMLVGIALRSRSSLEGTITLYNRLTAASDAMGVSQERVARVVETANKALATSNLTTGERTSALTQLAQGLGSGTLAGDELKAIRENSIVLAQAIADEFNTTIGGLKELGSEGELTSARVFRALEKASAGVDASFARTRATISDAFTNLETKTIQFVGKLDATTGASAKLASVIEFVANNLDEIAMAAQVAGVAVGTYYAGAMTVAAARTAAATASAIAYQLALVRMAAAQKGVTSAQILLNAALTANPIGLAIVAVAALTAGLVILNNTYGRSAVAARELAAVQERSSGFIDRYKQAQFEAANATRENAAAALEHVEALKKEGAEIIRVAQLNAQRRINEAVEARRTADRRIGEANERRSGQNNRSFSNASIIQDQAASQTARTAIAQAREAREAANDAIAAWTELQRAVSAPLPSTNVTSVPTSDSGSGSKAKGPTAEDLRRMREELALQGQLDLARAQGNEVEERRIQRLLDIRTLTEQLTRAEVDGAEAVATAQVDAVIAAEQAQRDLDKTLERSARNRDLVADREAEIAAEQERQLTFQLRLAEIAGDQTEIRRLERQLELLREINALGPNANPEREQQVRDEQGRINRAEDDARVMDQYRDGARTFVDILRSDDIWSEAGRRFQDAAWDNIEEVLAQVARAIFSNNGQGGGGGILSAIGGAIFGGNRALGGPVKQGMAYKVNENTANSEYFVAKSDGWVGNIKQPRASGRPLSVAIQQGDIYITGTGDAQLRAYVDRAVAIGNRQTIAAVKAGAPAANLERQLLKE